MVASPAAEGRPRQRPEPQPGHAPASPPRTRRCRRRRARPAGAPARPRPRPTLTPNHPTIISSITTEAVRRLPVSPSGPAVSAASVLPVRWPSRPWVRARHASRDDAHHERGHQLAAAQSLAHPAAGHQRRRAGADADPGPEPPEPAVASHRPMVSARRRATILRPVGERTEYTPGTFCWVDLGDHRPRGGRRVLRGRARVGVSEPVGGPETGRLPPGARGRPVPSPGIYQGQGGAARPGPPT